ncbi:MAG: 2Fe-2S iron-sulfur cluster-binding protein [Acidobacteriota bacterium]
MPKVTFIIDDVPQTVEFESGAVPYSHHGKPESLLDIAKHFHVPLEHACGGSCACTTCHVVVKEGANHLSEMQDDEADRLDTAWDLTPRSRLGCQAVVTGDVVCELPMYTRNYVQEGGGIQLGKSEARAQRNEALAGAVAAGGVEAVAKAVVSAVVNAEVRP